MSFLPQLLGSGSSPAGLISPIWLSRRSATSPVVKSQSVVFPPVRCWAVPFVVFHLHAFIRSDNKIPGLKRCFKGKCTCQTWCEGLFFLKTEKLQKAPIRHHKRLDRKWKDALFQTKRQWSLSHILFKPFELDWNLLLQKEIPPNIPLRSSVWDLVTRSAKVVVSKTAPPDLFLSKCDANYSSLGAEKHGNAQDPTELHKVYHKVIILKFRVMKW